MKRIKLLINKPLRGYKQGAIVLVYVYEHNGLPKDVYWQSRLKDAEIDNCITILKPKTMKIRRKRTNQKNLKIKGDYK